MKYDEAIKLIQGLSKKYSIYNNDKPVFRIIYKSKSIAWVGKNQQFDFGRINIGASEFNKLPYSHKLWMILSELAMTPLNKRKEHQWNVIIANNPNNWGYSYTAWLKTQNGYEIFDSFSKQNLVVFENARFTDSEFNDLIKYIKTLPDGEWQAKVAEHGKTEVKGE